MPKTSEVIVIKGNFEHLLQEEGAIDELGDSVKEIAEFLRPVEKVTDERGVVRERFSISRDPDESGESPQDRERPGAADGFDVMSEVSVVRLGDNRFRVDCPVFLTLFGPMLHLGDVFEAYPLGGREYAYHQMVESGDYLSRRFSVMPVERLFEGELRDALRRLVEGPGGWAWAMGNLWVEIARGSENDEVREWKMDIVRAVEDAVASIK